MLFYQDMYYSADDNGGGGAAGGQGGESSASGAGTGAAGGGDGAGGNQAAGDNASPPGQDGGNEQTFSKTEVEKMIADMQRLQQLDIAKLIEEERKKSKMTDDERAEFEREQKQKALDDREAAIALKELRAETAKLLIDKDLPQDFLDYVIGADIKDTLKRLDTFKPVFDKAVQEQVEKRLAGKSPERGNGGGTGAAAATKREEIRNILNG